MLLVDGTPAQGHDMEALEQALLAEIEQLKTNPVGPEELARVQAQVVASKVYELDSVFYQAMQIGSLETVGLDWRLLDEYVDRIKAVTPEQVRLVARKYLTADNMTVAVLDPLPLGDKQPAAAARGQHDALH